MGDVEKEYMNTDAHINTALIDSYTTIHNTLKEYEGDIPSDDLYTRVEDDDGNVIVVAHLHIPTKTFEVFGDENMTHNNMIMASQWDEWELETEQSGRTRQVACLRFIPDESQSIIPSAPYYLV